MRFIWKKEKGSKTPPEKIYMDRPTNKDTLDRNLEKNINDFREFAGNSYDINIRKIKIPMGEGISAALLYVKGLADEDSINDAIIKTLIYSPYFADIQKVSTQKALTNILTEKMIAHAKVEQAKNWTDILDNLFSGDTILLVNSVKCAIVIGTRKWSDRGVEQPVNEQVIRGPRDSFNETIVTNTMLLRRRIKSPKLQFEMMEIGSLTKTDTIIAYIDGIVNPKIVEEVRKRMKRIEIDGILESNMIEEFIEDNPLSPLPQVFHTERPDVAAAQLLEGRVIILVDGVPNVLVVPTTFWKFIYSPEDYYQKIYFSSAIRILRIVTLIIALCLPSFYVAITTFHQELIPVGILDIIVSGHRNVPFPIVIEVLIMEFTLEVIREAGVRLPRSVGQAISIVGALVLGQAAIQAKMASPATVTIVAITAISNFTLPAFSAALAIRILRFVLLLISGILGVFGFLTALFVFLIHLCSLRSFGEPYMAPIAPAVPSDLKDSLIRLPIWTMNKRPKGVGAKNVVRQKRDLRPKPEQK